MAKHFFDILDENGTEIDRAGGEFRDLNTARDEAVKAVTELGRDLLRAKEKGRLTIIVRDDSGPVLEVAAAYRVRPMRG